MTIQNHQRFSYNNSLLINFRGLSHLSLFLTILSLLLPQCSEGEATVQENNPIKIGAIFSETGIAASHNQPLIEMAKLAVLYINDNGGILGRPMELVHFDNLSTPIGSALGARQVVFQDLTAVIGAHWSSHSLAMAPILQEAGIPMISPGSTNPEVTQAKDFIFRACFVDSFQGVAMAKFARSDLQAKSAVVVTNIDEDYSTTLGQFFGNAFKKNGGQVTAELNYRGDANDFSANIQELIRLKPDVVYLPGYTRDSGLFIKQAVKMGLSAIFLGGDAWDEIGKYAGSAVNGSYQSAPWHPEVPFAASKKMQDLFFRAYHREVENTSSPLAYDAVMILADAITRAGNLEHKAIRDALAATIEFPGATGTITFDKNGDPLRKSVNIIQFHEGKNIFKKAIIP